jgi:hypothetical protein
MPKRPAKQPPLAPAPQTVPIFLVTFEHAQRSFKCVLLDWEAPNGRNAKQWVVTMAGRPVWSFEAGPSDTHESVQAEVRGWWDSQE